MKFPKLTEMEDALASHANACSEFKIAVLRNIVLENIEPYIRYAGIKDCLSISLEWGNFDNILQEANGFSSGVINGDLQAIVIALWLPAFSELLGYSFASSSLEDVESELKRVQDYCIATLSALRKKTDVPILWFSFEPTVFPAYGILDPTLRQSQRSVISSLNKLLSSELSQAGNAWLVDTGICLERIGAQNFYDWRYWHLSRSPYSRSALAQISHELQKHIRAFTGRFRKCLVLDCDNTLWGGVVGEVGLTGICIGNSYPGLAYREFQLAVLDLFSRGVILCLCSKNNESDVLDVLRDHQRMVLREHHFSCIKANWRDKVSNLKEIAAELNIGLDSIVFVDDSDFEANLVERLLPEVSVVKASREAPYENRIALAECGLFDTHSLTNEDRSRGKLYADEAQRKRISSQVDDLEDYLITLNMRLYVESVTEDQISRAAQLCQRTNQFNSTCIRYTSDQLLPMLNSENMLLLLLRLTDQFGDYGSVGFCIVTLDRSIAHIDTFLLSCRALGRGVESAFLALSIEAITKKNAKTLTARYVRSNKNAQVKAFFIGHGFSLTRESDQEIHYSLDLERSNLSVPAHFEHAALEW